MSADIILPCILGRLHGQTRVFPAHRVLMGDVCDCAEYIIKNFIIDGDPVTAYVKNGVPDFRIKEELKKWITTRGPLDYKLES